MDETVQYYFYISTHASAREATYNIISIRGINKYFNSRLRTGGDELGKDKEKKERISTHASAREATT